MAKQAAQRDGPTGIQIPLKKGDAKAACAGAESAGTLVSEREDRRWPSSARRSISSPSSIRRSSPAPGALTGPG
jgi:hypothetical protein